MTREEREKAVKTLIDMANVLCLNPDTPQGAALKMAIKALKQEPCKNVISRQAVLDIIEDRIKNGLAENVAISQYYRMEVEKLPPVNPQKLPQYTKCDRCPYGETKVVNICNYDGDGCGWD